MPKKKCTCALKKSTQSCPNCSSYKIVFLLKNTSAHLKNTNASGDRINPVWWSFLKDEKKPLKELFGKMLDRARKSTPELYNGSNCIFFYHRNGTSPIDSHYPS